jgi:oligogalacturonide transporter
VDELSNGQRREGLFTSVMGFMAKLEISLCFLLVGYILSWSGLDTKQATQPADVLHSLFWLCVLPNIAFTFLGLILTVKFPVTPESMAVVRRQLDERRLAKAAAGEPTDEVAEQLVHDHPEIIEGVRHKTGRLREDRWCKARRRILRNNC